MPNLEQLFICVYQAKVIGAKEALTEITKENTERLRKINSLLSQKKVLDEQLNARQQKTVFCS